jgi:hypothetical protein
MREAYRLQKNELLYDRIRHIPGSLILAIQYIGAEDLPYEVLSGSMHKALNRIAHELA